MNKLRWMHVNAVAADLLTYQRELDAKRLQVLNEMTAYDQALGLQ